MRLVVCHLTRMRPGAVCFAGIDLETGKSVRPVLPVGDCWTPADLAASGGSIELSALVDVGSARDVSLPPEVEDRQVAHRSVARLCRVHATLFWTLLQAVAREGVREVFGPDLERNEGRVTALPGRGRASLGVIRPAGEVTVEVITRDNRKRVRLHCEDAEGALDLPVTDLRLYDPATGEVRDSEVRRLGDIRDWGRPLIAVGLTRPYGKTATAPKLHYLQVNNIYPEGRPLWELGPEATRAHDG